MTQHRPINYPLLRIGFTFSVVGMGLFLMAGCNSNTPPVTKLSQERNASLLKLNTPEWVWNAMRTKLLSGKLDEAIQHFSVASAEQYRKSFQAMEKDEIAATMNKIIKKAAIEGDTAQYYFEDVIGGETITFPVEFVKENGVWKILEF